MSHADLQATIEAAFDDRDNVGINTQGEIREAVNDALNLLDSGAARVAEQGSDGNWVVNQWLKKAVLLSFRLNDMEVIPNGSGKSTLLKIAAGVIEDGLDISGAYDLSFVNKGVGMDLKPE